MKRSNKTKWRAVTFNAPDLPSPAELMRKDSARYACFGKFETQRAAQIMVEFFALYIRGWKPFTLGELHHFCLYGANHTNIETAVSGLLCTWFDDNGLGIFRIVDPPYIVQIGDKLAVTTEFIRVLAEAKTPSLETAAA